MRIESSSLPQAARNHSRVHSGKAFPEAAANGQAAAAIANQSATASKTASPAPESLAAKPATDKLTPAGLLAAQARFAAMNPETMNDGQTQAQTSINRNIERYQSVQSDTGTTGTTGSLVAEA